MKHFNTVITGTGCYVPSQIISNSAFVKNIFFEKDQSLIETEGEEVVQKFKDITGISERRWVTDDLNSSDIAAIAAQRAIEDAGIDPETIDQIILAQNFGNVASRSIQTENVPSLASRVKHALGIKNTDCIPYDIIFGCPGWIQGVIQANSFIKSGMAKRCLVIGTETLSRVVDHFDRDTMIFSDGAGAVIVEGLEEDEKRGMLSYSFVSHTAEEVDYLYHGKSNSPDGEPLVGYIKMNGRKIYEYSLLHVPGAMKTALDRAGIEIDQVKKIVIHQANEKMDEAIVMRFFRQYGIKPNLAEIMPMNIQKLGNSSVATVPTLYDMILKNQVEGHQISKNDILIFASIGAGMNINSFVYKQ
ncbi:MAG: 3-oxoacyl-ACP synthase [Bacteroidetes bacterium HGW-Bacteroidetes-1]|jgi:3-oxoacyl-[acyl-carrier-protein] synthase-3|nr:MAG: 3-oxoacyl-ACP synthase [Bacteroidetes bacterium HGW-Bacteroidetes-1]